MWLNAVSWRLRHIQSAFRLSGSAVWLWPILRGDWQSSLNGQVAVSNCLWIALFDAAVADMPRQQTGLYLCENQAWEKALLRAWRRWGHGEIIGVQHATVPFWHLYYFNDSRCLTTKQDCALPSPDRLAVNGMAAWGAFTGAGYPVKGLVEVEALRYLNLSGVVAKRRANSMRGGAVKPSGSESPRIDILILGDMMPTSMHHLLSLLQETMGLFPSGYRFTFKPHPAYSVNLADYPGVTAEQTKDALGRILGDYDAVVVANSTSAAVDAYVAGLPVIIGLDGDDLNLSPLRDQPGVRFVSTREELAEALETAVLTRAMADSNRGEFFFLDPDLPRWKRLLARASPTCMELASRENSNPRSVPASVPLDSSVFSVR